MSREHEHCRTVELDPQGATWDAATRAHAESCPACAALVRGVADLTQRLRRVPALTASAPAGARERLLASLDAAPSNATATAARESRGWFARRAAVPLALAATLALGMILGRNVDSLWPGRPAEVHRNIGMYIHDVTHDHYLLERIGRPLEVAITDRAALSDWLAASLNFRLELPASPAGYRLQGGRVWHTVGRLSALASYEAPGGDRVVLFAVPSHNLDLVGAESSMIRGRQVFSGLGWEREARVWIDGDLAMALVAPAGRLPVDWAEAFLP